MTPPAIDTKPTNPKDAIGSTKLPMHLVPSSVMTYASLAFLEGALKYGKYNWRVAGVRFSIYLDAMHRHLAKLQNGEWADATTGVPHLASVIACAGILADANDCGMLTDDRPPASPVSRQIDASVDVVQHLKEVFKDHNPHQHTIGDANERRTQPGVRAEVSVAAGRDQEKGSPEQGPVPDDEAGSRPQGGREGCRPPHSIKSRWIK